MKKDTEKTQAPKEGENGKGLDLQMKKIAVHYAKIVCAALGIWTVGWFGFHYVWVLMGLLIYTLWKMNKRDKEKRMKSLKEITRNEQKVLSSMKDLPAWVRQNKIVASTLKGQEIMVWPRQVS